MRRPLVIYDFATALFWISLNMRKMLFSFYQCILLPPSSLHVFHCSSFHFSLPFLLLHPSFPPLLIVTFTILFFALFTFPFIPSFTLLSPLSSLFLCSSLNQFFLHSYLPILTFQPSFLHIMSSVSSSLHLNFFICSLFSFPHSFQPFSTLPLTPGCVMSLLPLRHIIQLNGPVAPPRGGEGIHSAFFSIYIQGRRIGKALQGLFYSELA